MKNLLQYWRPTPWAKVLATKTCWAKMVLVALVLSLPFCQSGVAQQTASYTWKQAKVGPLGFVTGLVIHPSATSVKYIRTDVGGAFRWESASATWTPLNDLQMQGDSLTDGTFGVDSIALDANNSSLVYILGGSPKANGDVYKSSDKGATWTAMGMRKSDGSRVYVGSNDDWRHTGERLVVDSNANGQVIYCGTRKDGLFRSTDGGQNWSTVTLPSNGTSGIGVTFVVFDKSTGSSSQASQTIYVGVAGVGVYRSTNGGQNWATMSGSPDATYIPCRAALGAGGLYVTYQVGTKWSGPTGGAIYRFSNGSGVAISPKSDGYCGLSVLAGSSASTDTVMASSWSYSTIYRSSNSGTAWTTVNPSWVQPAYLPSWYGQNWVAQIVIDPENTARTWLVNGTGVYRTDDNSGQNQTYTMRSDGIEELCAINVHKVPGGPLYFGVADLNGFTITNLDQYPTKSWEQGEQGLGTSLDWFENSGSPSKQVVRVGGKYDYTVFDRKSSDAGDNWTAITTPKGVTWGAIAMSATNANWLVRLGEGWARPYYSHDGGSTWNSIGGPDGTPDSGPTWQPYFDGPYSASVPIASDRVNGNIFYLYGKDGSFWRSDDGGVKWTQVCTTASGQLPDDWRYAVKATPGVEREVWINFTSVGTNNGLYRSTDGGATWTKISGVNECVAYGFGKAASGQTRPAVFLYGKVNGATSYGLYRSDDLGGKAGNGGGASWLKINSDSQPLPRPAINGLDGDREVFSKVYLGSDGRGLFYGVASNAPALGSGTGLKGDYYTGVAFNTLVKSQTDSTVNFDWGTGSPKNTDGTTMSSVGPDNFSVRWSGQVQAVEAGTYTFTTTTDDGVRLYLNGATTAQIDKWVAQGPTSYSTSLNLTAGQKISVKMEYYEATGGAVAKLLWTRPGGSSVVIPQTQLYPPIPTYTKLSGNPIGTSGSWKGLGNDLYKVFDGDDTTYFDAPEPGNGDWVGLDVGSAKQITKIRFIPRADAPQRMNEAKFQGSSTADFSSGVTTLWTLSAVPTTGWNEGTSISSSTPVRYVRCLFADGTYGNVSEMEFYTSP